MAEVQTGATVDLTPILPKPDPPTLAKSFSRDAPLPLQEAEEVMLFLLTFFAKSSSQKAGPAEF